MNRLCGEIVVPMAMRSSLTLVLYLVVRTLGITGAHKKARDGHALRGLFVLSKELVWTMDTIPDSKATDLATRPLVSLCHSTVIAYQRPLMDCYPNLRVP
jgi:hypothetical protein